MKEARQRAFAEQVLQEVRDAHAGGERVGGVGAQAEVVREDALADQPGDPAEENAGGDQRRRPRPPARRLGGSSAQSRSSSGATWPSVPFDFFIRYDLMN